MKTASIEFQLLLLVKKIGFTSNGDILTTKELESRKWYILQLWTHGDHLLGNFTASIGPLRWQMPSQPTNQFWISNTRNKHPNQTYWGHIYLLFLNVTRKSKNEQKNRPYNFVPRLRCSFKHHSQIENKSNHWGKMTWALWPIFWFLMFQFGSNLWTCASFLLLMSRKIMFAVFSISNFCVGLLSWLEQ